MGLAPIEWVRWQNRSGSGDAFSRTLVAVDMGGIFRQSAGQGLLFSGASTVGMLSSSVQGCIYKVNCAARQGESPIGERGSSGGEGALGHSDP